MPNRLRGFGEYVEDLAVDLSEEVRDFVPWTIGKIRGGFGMIFEHIMDQVRDNEIKELKREHGQQND